MTSQLICTISGSKINEPVVSTLTGHVFERSTIEKHIEINGSCPITGKPMDVSTIVPMKCSVSSISKQIKSNGVPSMIQNLKDQWDETAIESMYLKQHLQKVRNELSHALYQQDAACRVISRLVSERDGYRDQLSKLKGKYGDLEEIEAKTNKTKFFLSHDLIERLEEKSMSLKNMRRDRRKMKNAFVEYSEASDISNFNLLRFSQTRETPITSLSIDPFMSNCICIGYQAAGLDLYNLNTGKIDASLPTGSFKKGDIIFNEFLTANQTEDNLYEILVISSNGNFFV